MKLDKSRVERIKSRFKAAKLRISHGIFDDLVVNPENLVESKDKIGVIYSAPNHLYNLLKSDYPFISKSFGPNLEDIAVFRFQETGCHAFDSRLIPKEDDLFSYNYFKINHNKMTLDVPESGFIPETKILVARRDYGYICKKQDFPSVRGFIESLKLTPDFYNKAALNNVFWTNRNVSLRNDVEFFSASKGWFEKRSLPYSRSYLLYGPPGNGKTSAIRAISKYFYSPPSQFSFTARYEDPDSAFQSWIVGNESSQESDFFCDDMKLTPLRSRAFMAKSLLENDLPNDEENNPKIKILLLEDIDRFFSKEEGFKTPISFSTVLNALDGVFQRKNSILIATANHPEKIDSQVLFRPGRFDLRVPFDSPNEEEMFSFLKHVTAEDKISEAALEKASKLALGHSFAFAKGVYLSAANRAFSRSSHFVEDIDFLSSLDEFVGNLGNSVKSTKPRAGF